MQRSAKRHKVKINQAQLKGILRELKGWEQTDYNLYSEHCAFHAARFTEKCGLFPQGGEANDHSLARLLNNYRVYGGIDNSATARDERRKARRIGPLLAPWELTKDGERLNPEDFTFPEDSYFTASRSHTPRAFSGSSVSRSVDSSSSGKRSGLHTLSSEAPYSNPNAIFSPEGSEMLGDMWNGIQVERGGQKPLNKSSKELITRGRQREVHLGLTL